MKRERTILNIVIILAIIGLGVYFSGGNEPEIIDVEGHRYIKYTSYYSSDLDHSPECWCFKDSTNSNFR